MSQFSPQLGRTVLGDDCVEVIPYEAGLGAIRTARLHPVDIQDPRPHVGGLHPVSRWRVVSSVDHYGHKAATEWRYECSRNLGLLPCVKNDLTSHKNKNLWLDSHCLLFFDTEGERLGVFRIDKQ